MAGEVLVDGQPGTKPGAQLKRDVRLALRGEPMAYASRGGLKLAHALQRFDIDVAGRVCLDAGASTGGFTDCLLQHGARHVHAVDVGYGQLRGFLAADARVSVFEKTNVSDIPALSPPPEFCGIDLSYLSLSRALPIVRERVGALPSVALVKPLYEGLAEPDVVNRDAILVVVERLLAALMPAFGVLDVCLSPITGGRGAVECLIHVDDSRRDSETPRSLVERLAADWKEPV